MKMTYRSLFLGILAPLAIMACSDAPDPIAKGRSHFATRQSSAAPDGFSCQNATWGAIANYGTVFNETLGAEVEENNAPELPPSSGDPIDPGKPVFDGENDEYEVSCVMTKDGDNVTLEIEYRGPNTSDFVFGGNRWNTPTSLRVDAELNLVNGVGRGEAVAFTGVSGNVSPREGTDCTFKAASPLQDADGNPNSLRIDADSGEVWMTYSCAASVESKAQSNSFCEHYGTVIMENCTIR
ncbi:MAG: hypothetical protein MK135_06120 [Polyangiaceae bacterium]|nr:hypothetical protein [Polyangiaceae bacterium]